MSFRRWLGAIRVGAVLLLGAAGFEAAAACNPPALSAFVYSPRDGEINVPTNAVVDVHVFSDSIPTDIVNQFTLWQALTPITATTSRVDSNVSYSTAIRLTPCGFCLVANMQYLVRQGTTSSSPILATFTTGSAPDTTLAPPPLTTATASVNGFDTHPDGGSDCFTERIRQVRLNVPDIGKPVVYTLREGGQLITADDLSLVGSFYCSGQPHWQGDTSWIVAPGQHTLQLSAVDRIGHSSSPVDVSFNASCDGGLPDGGTPGGGGGPGSEGGGPVTATSCGCGTGIGGAIALTGLAVILRTRKRTYAANSMPPS